MTHGEEKSDRVVVPEKSPNKAVGTAAEGMEERTLAKGNAGEVGIHRTQSRERMNQRLARVREAARKDGKQRFTALMHHVYNIDTLAFAYWSLDRRSAPWIDGVTWQSYGEALEDNLQDLSARLKRGGYRASAVRRVFIPKADGRQRPLGVPTLEDKLVQRALVEVMNAIYEVDFLGFSYGFRPNRSQHNALDAVSVGLERRKVNWVLDADIQGFFFTHICGKTRRGRFKVQRKTMRKRFQRVLLEVETTLRKRWHWPIPQIGKWLAAVVRGHVRYFGVPGNGPRLTAFRFAIGRLWYRALRRRSQNDQTSWARARRLIDLYLPKARSCHPYPDQRLHVTTQGRSPVRSFRSLGSVEGVLSDGHSYSDGTGSGIVPGGAATGGQGDNARLTAH